MAKKFEKRFGELSTQFDAVKATRRCESGGGRFPDQYFVDSAALLNWRVKVKNLLEMACGATSAHFTSFEKVEAENHHSGAWGLCEKLGAVFLAAKEDYEGGYLISLKSLVQAEVFDDELDQARELLSKGYALPAAVIAGVVLETTIKVLCNRNGIPLGKFEAMNEALVKADVHNGLQKKQLTALAGVRNAAAHGDTEVFKGADVKSMIEDIHRFVANAMS